jgi:class 3 adenylate cyclase/tetratricopeptide (TPR) repeat protein
VDERKIATVLFADLVGSTAMGGAQDPERIRAVLERFYEAMTAEIVAAGGEVEKFAGDAVMAAFGAPAAYEDHAERALHAALSMRRRLDELFEGRLELRIGVNTGQVMVGTPREGSSFVSGDAVNVAARLEQAAEPGEILVGERTAAAARGAFEFGPPTTVEAKGKPNGVRCRRLDRSISTSRPRGLQGLRRPFVGRAGEFEQLLGAYRGTVADGHPRLVTVVGDSGVGKSRLVAELWGRLAAERATQLVGRCLPYGRGITYRALGDMLREHLGIHENDPPTDVLEKLGDRGILGLTLGLDTAGALHPLAARERLHDAWVGLFASLAGRGPVVALFEDLHWAEPPLLDVIEQCVRDVDGPLLVLGTARPEFLGSRAGWGTGRYRGETIWLEPLSAATAGELVDSALGGALPPTTRDRLVARTEGNPLFLEETLQDLVDRGLLRRDGDAWSLTEFDPDLEIPDTVQSVVASRIDLLGLPEKTALQAAAVVGRIFWTEPVYALVRDHDRPDLRVLEDRDFVRRRATSSLEGEREYAFKHAITREVAYRSVPLTKRARWHAEFAEWIVHTVGPRDEVASILAHHYAAAVGPDVADLAWGAEPERALELRDHAVRWLRRAGELAMGRHELDEATALFQLGLSLEPGLRDEVELWRLLGRAAALRYDGTAMSAALERAIDRCDDPAMLAELYAEMAYQTSGRPGMWTRFPDRDRVDGWIDRAMELAEPGSRARAQALIALCYWRQERPAWALEEAERIVRELDDAALLVDALVARAFGEFAQGRFADALRSAQAALDAEREVADPDAGERLRESLTALFVMCGRLDQATQLVREHVALGERLFPHHRLHSVALEIELHEVAGDWPAIRELVPRLRQAVDENTATPCVRGPRSLLASAAACAALGDPAEADGLEREADVLAARDFGWIMDAPRLRLALHRGDLDAVRRLESRAGASISRRQIWYFPAAVAAHFDGLAALGDADEAERDAPEFLNSDSVLVAFAMRALGMLRRDPALVEASAARFAELGFGAQAAATRASVQR